jgi:hypothetical protein
MRQVFRACNWLQTIWDSNATLKSPLSWASKLPTVLRMAFGNGEKGRSRNLPSYHSHERKQMRLARHRAFFIRRSSQYFLQGERHEVSFNGQLLGRWYGSIISERSFSSKKNLNSLHEGSWAASTRISLYMNAEAEIIKEAQSHHYKAAFINSF